MSIPVWVWVLHLNKKKSTEYCFSFDDYLIQHSVEHYECSTTIFLLLNALTASELFSIQQLNLNPW